MHTTKQIRASTIRNRSRAMLGLVALAGIGARVAAQVMPETPGARAIEVGSDDRAARVEWGYTGPTGPEHWSTLSKDYAICNNGQQESPIDLRNAIPADLGKLAVAWKPLAIRATNNGHTVQYDAPPGSNVTFGGKTYALAQFHIHHPSEHLVNGRRFPLEIHFVHTVVAP